MIRCTAYRKRDLYMTNCRASLAFLPDAMQRKKATDKQINVRLKFNFYFFYVHNDSPKPKQLNCVH